MIGGREAIRHTHTHTHTPSRNAAPDPSSRLQQDKIKAHAATKINRIGENAGVLGLFAAAEQYRFVKKLIIFISDDEILFDYDESLMNDGAVSNLYN